MWTSSFGAMEHTYFWSQHFEENQNNENYTVAVAVWTSLKLLSSYRLSEQ